ncbi:hypothetical protein PPL_10430 [Heterostelium album PN500]|uniref:B box-type domain-containing protein n=1 Tax=Heterostelium pallidum (strain ATCC 26659 / Pp 5 / PN500) TaxID=670386 RepID=D3BR26_HETP5|nr:hypothetical protein PPL_10430 [Heterostelium album PN500]EFA75858.1 hypothetical protein PPL_10430 [Heterostelium album PN500]|eukprot:XP_020427992.1 hypothetical protein PPL_10430 [Heterostelium album PN500]
MDESRCSIHNKYLEFLCSTCNEIVCVKCCTSVHRGHLIDDLESITQSEQYTERLEYLWRLMNRCTVMIESFNKTEQKIVQHYNELHTMLMTEELKIKKPILDERREAETLLKTILEELKSLNIIIKSSNTLGGGGEDTKQLEDNDNHSEKDSEDEKEEEEEDVNWNSKEMNSSVIIESIRDSSSINEFMSSTIINGLGNGNGNSSSVGNGHGNGIGSSSGHNSGLDSSCSGSNISECFHENNYSLLKRIKEYSGSFKTNSYKLPNHFDIRFEEERLENARSMLSNMYEIVDLEDDQPVVSTCHHVINMLLTVGENGIHFFDLETLEWSQHKAEDYEERLLPFNSLAATRDYIFIFGGSNKSNSYSRFNIATRQWDHSAPIQTKLGGCGISTCYDGSRYIYLIGGATKTGRVTRIDSFDTETMEFEHVGAMEMPRSESLSFYLDGIIYIVGGCDLAGKEIKNMLAFNIASGECTTYIEHMGFRERIIASCFDGHDKVYILDKERNFYSVSIKTKSKEILNPPLAISNSSNKHSMIFCPKKFRQNSSEILFIGGKTHQNHFYSVDKNKWSQIDKSVDTIYRSYDGAIGYYSEEKKSKSTRLS